MFLAVQVNVLVGPSVRLSVCHGCQTVKWRCSTVLHAGIPLVKHFNIWHCGP